MSTEPQTSFQPVGSNPARLLGYAADEWMRRIAANQGLRTTDGGSGEATILANLDFVWDPVWLRWIGGRPGTVLVHNGQPVLAHVMDGMPSEPVAAAMQGKGKLPPAMTIAEANGAELSYSELRKRDRPFVMPLEPSQSQKAERALYDASYKGVTDVLTLYLWRRPAFHLTRWAAEIGMTPNLVTSIGALFCLLAFYLFWNGHLLLGVIAGFAFMVLDTVDGKLARCTGTSSKWGNIFDHGIDLIHPPFWWWAWANGLKAYGTPLEPVYETMLLGAIIGGYVVARIVEGVFMRRFGMHIHVWQKIDSQFRLVTARRNPNMAILVAALAFGRPDVGLELVALWTLLSLIFHAVRFAQATARRDRGRAVTSWLG